MSLEACWTSRDPITGCHNDPPTGSCYPFPTFYHGDRFLSSYTHGPLGPIARTDEDPDGDEDAPEGNLDQLGDGDLSNNRDFYYLRDAMGGHVALLHDHDGNPLTAALWAGSAVHDSFGNRMTASPSPLASTRSSPLAKGGSEGGLSGGSRGVSSRTSDEVVASESSGLIAGASSEDDMAKRGSFAWRGGEGSVTDREPNLIHMQARHYDPTLGRFLQADSLLLASFTTQGTNRYLYTENDPVNMSDPAGQSIWGVLSGLGMIATIVTSFYVNPLMGYGALVGAIMAMFFEFGRQLAGSTCLLGTPVLNWDAIASAGFAGALLGAVAPTVAPGYLGRASLSTILTTISLRGGAGGGIGVLWGLLEFLF